jgi:hypothetical protein
MKEEYSVRIKITTLVMACAVGLFASSCRWEPEECRSAIAGEEALVTLSLTVPGVPPSRAYAITPAENAVSTVDVLLFKQSSNPAVDDKFYYRAIGSTPTPGDAENKKVFTVKLPLTDGSFKYRVVVLANARAAINAITDVALKGALTPATVAGGSTFTREDVLDGIVMTATSGSPVTGSDIPMWGYKNDVEILAGATPPELEIDLTRAVVRVDVSLKQPDVDNFTITSVRLYNRENRGSIAPAVSGTSYSPWTGPTATPNIPGGTNPDATPVSYSVASPGIESRNTIYAFEAPRGSVADPGWEDNCCLVIGGNYTRDGATVETYYRVDFATDPGDPDTYLHLIRNHAYDVEVQKVNGHGWPSAKEAFENRPSNIEVTIVPWNEGSLNEIVFSGQSYLAVDKSKVYLYKEGNEKHVEVTTNYRVNDATVDSWVIELDDVQFPWLEVSPGRHDGSNNEDPQTLTVRVKPGPEHAIDAGTPRRDAYFFIVAGNLKKRIDVVQLNEVEFWITITGTDGKTSPGELLFGPGDYANSDYPDPLQFVVTWMPAASTPAVTVTAVGTMAPFDFGSGDDPTSDPITNGAAFTVRPPFMTEAELAVNPFLARASRLDFSLVLDGQVKMVPIHVRQVNHAIVIEESEVETSYFADGTEQHEFTVRSNAPWVARVPGTDEGLFASMTTSGGPDEAGEPFSFVFDTRTGDPDPAPRTVTVTFSSPRGLFPDKTVDLVNKAWEFLGYSLDGSTILQTPADATPVEVPVTGGTVYLHARTSVAWLGWRTTAPSSPVSYSPVTPVTGYQANSIVPVEVPPTGAASLESTIDAGYGTTTQVSFKILQKVPTYAFTDDGKTLTLFANFPRGTETLDGLNSTNILELVTDATVVEKLVIAGTSFPVGQLGNVKTKCGPGNLLPNVKAVSFSEFAGAIPFECFRASGTDEVINTWLTEFEAPVSNGISTYAFRKCTSLLSVNVPGATSVGNAAFRDCSSLESVNFPAANTINYNAFNGCTSLASVDFQVATSFQSNAFSGCTALATLKLGAKGAISFDGNIFYNVTTSGVALFLDAANIPSSGNDWNGFTWASIKPY